MEIQSFTRRKYVILISYIFGMLFFFTHHSIAIANEQQKHEDQKISYLIKRVAASKAIFMRNGDKHSAQEAAEHLENKMKRARRTFGFFGSLQEMSAKIFIDKIASKSSMSGNPYKMKLPSGETVNTGVWLHDQLKTFKADNKK